MTDEPPPPRATEYRCPGEKRPISRAVHLGRLAAFFPACRQCPHRDDTGALSARQVAQLVETRRRGRSRRLFHEEGAGGVFLNDLAPADARRIAAVFATMVREKGFDAPGSRRPVSQLLSNPQSPIPNPSVLLAGDGRPLSAELAAAADEGLRSTGCDVVDIGPATSASLAFGMASLDAEGGILVGNPGREPHAASLGLWIAGPRPLSASGSLEPLARAVEADERRAAETACQTESVGLGATAGLSSGAKNTGGQATRGTRQLHAIERRAFGAMRRRRAEEPYLARLAEFYHALRPLRIAVDSASKPWIEFFQRLAGTVACEMIVGPVGKNAAHLGVSIDGNGETCRAFDEQGREVPSERLLFFLLGAAGERPTVVLETGTSLATIERAKRQGIQTVLSGVRRADMAAAMRESGAWLGGGPSGRFWHADLGFPLPDALVTVTKLLVLLSRGDEPFSVALDRATPWG